MRAKQHKRIPFGVRLKMPGLFPLWTAPLNFSHFCTEMSFRCGYMCMVFLEDMLGGSFAKHLNSCITTWSQFDPSSKSTHHHCFFLYALGIWHTFFFVFTLILNHRLNLHLDTKTTIPDQLVHILCFFCDFPIQ